MKKSCSKKVIQSAACLTLAGALCLFPCNAFALTKDETVYAKLGTDGSASHISAVEHLVNEEQANEIRDRSGLTNLENLNGFESFVVNGEEVVWAANGNDIYYSGETAKELPVKLEATYKLNGERKTPDEMLGQAGTVEIRLHFTNLSKVDDLYTPFVVAVATTLTETQNSKVTVTNGEATSNGKTIAIAAAAAPGLYESLGLAELKGLDEVVINYETKSFALNDIYAVVTPEIFHRDDLKVFEQLDELHANVNTLGKSSQQLVQGSAELRDGLAKLQNGIATMKKQIQAQGNLLDAVTLNRIKSTAAAAAEQQAAANVETVRAAVHQQVAGNKVLLDALGLEAIQLCSAQAGTTCTETMAADVKQKLVSGVEEQLVTSSLEVAKTTAHQTAAATAESVATQVASSIQTGMSAKLVKSLGALENAVGQLAAGANSLNAGMAEFDRAGIQTLTSFVNSKVRVTSDRLQRLTNLAANYQSFGGTVEGAISETKFIYMIEGKKPEGEE